jgi:hypothetical protein
MYEEFLHRKDFRRILVRRATALAVDAQWATSQRPMVARNKADLQA